MDGATRLSLGLAALFVATFLIAYGFGWMASWRRRPRVPEVGASLRIRCDSGVLRSRSLGEFGSGWRFSAPLRRDAYVPLRVGEKLIVEAAAEGGALLFRSTVTARDAETHVFTASMPAEVHLRERRLDVRRSFACQAAVDGEVGALVDASAGGAKIVLPRAPSRGQDVAVVLPWLDGKVAAVVLDTESGGTRVRFFEPLPMP